MWITILPCNPSKQERALAASEILVEFVPRALLLSHRGSEIGMSPGNIHTLTRTLNC